MTPRRRHQPGSGATRAEPVFPTKREGPARRRRRHAMVAEALVPLDAARVAIRIATRVATVYTNAPKRPRGAILANLCTLLRPHGRSQQPNSPTVYTNAPIRRGEARSSHLCTLLRSQGHSQPKPTAQQCTQMPQNGSKRPDPPICVHYCDPKATHNPRPRPNSVHKCPETAPRGHFHRFVYTIVFSRLSATAQQCTQMPQNGTDRPFSAICVHYCVLASVRNSATAQQCTQMPQNGSERPFPPICVHYCVLASVRNSPTVYTNASKRH